jgi:hypothetical protein
MLDPNALSRIDFDAASFLMEEIVSTVDEIVKAVEGLKPKEFLKLRGLLDRIEERLWQQELGRVTAKQRAQKLTDAKIDELVMKRRHRGDRS